MKINNVLVDDELINFLIKSVRNKKTLSNLDSEFITREIVKFLSNHLNHIPKLHNEKSKEHKELIKFIRAKSHDVYEIFQTGDINKRNELLFEIKKLSKENVIPLLDTHISTKERLSSYNEVYKKIFAETNIPNSILDIGCGLNPISIPFMNFDSDKLKKIKYFASELSCEDLKIIDSFFEKFKINGKTFACNLVHDFEKLKEYKCDVCFAFKLFDVLETQKKNVGYDIIESLNCKYLVASFALTNIKQEAMKREKVHYFERFLSKLGLSFDSFLLMGELFYIVPLKDDKDLEK
ncbi:MAG: hypothetical protein WC755_04310 [Candidatus Woesearchaeota archaeon]|jgi:16S rRNA (guanine(1405)-N(7))-methyltransferase